MTAPVEVHNLSDMVGGWFVGAFQPNVLSSSAMEVGVKRYRAGDTEAAHVHRVATEVTLVLEGRAAMAGRTLGPGDIIVLPAGTVTGFSALEDCTTVVVKAPSVPGDKYLADREPEERS